MDSAITSIVGWVGEIVSLLTTAPISYFLSLGLVGGAIGIFGRAKRAAR